MGWCMVNYCCCWKVAVGVRCDGVDTHKHEQILMADKDPLLLPLVHRPDLTTVLYDVTRPLKSKAWLTEISMVAERVTVTPLLPPTSSISFFATGFNLLPY